MTILVEVGHLVHQMCISGYITGCKMSLGATAKGASGAKYSLFRADPTMGASRGSKDPHSCVWALQFWKKYPHQCPCGRQVSHTIYSSGNELH